MRGLAALLSVATFERTVPGDREHMIAAVAAARGVTPRALRRSIKRAQQELDAATRTAELRRVGVLPWEREWTEEFALTGRVA